MRHSSRRPINSVKNIVDGTFLGVTGGTTTDFVVVNAVNDYTGLVAGDVPVGATVSSVYLFVQAVSATGTANVDYFMAKGPGNVMSNLPVPGATGGNQNRRFILHEEKGIPGNAADGAYPLTFKGVIKIPRGRQRIAESDKFIVSIQGADTYNACVKAIYKFYR